MMKKSSFSNVKVSRLNFVTPKVLTQKETVKFKLKNNIAMQYALLAPFCTVLKYSYFCDITSQKMSHVQLRRAVHGEDFCSVTSQK